MGAAETSIEERRYLLSQGWERFKDELLADPETLSAYDAQHAAYDLASKLIELRKRLGLSQRDLARAAGMKQPEIARIEKGRVSPTWETVSRILRAVGAEVQLTLRVPGGKRVKVHPPR
jgi:DNA-binding XRE family transcriptional regulator